MLVCELNLPYPPSINHIWVRSRYGMRRSDAYMNWLTLATLAAEQQQLHRITGPYRMTVQIARPDRRKRDLDNVGFKAISDLLVKLELVDDDSCCEMLSARWVSEGTGAYVRVEEMSSSRRAGKTLAARTKRHHQN